MNPNYATAHQWYATVLLVTKRYDESVAEGKRAQEIDPLSLIITTNMAGYYFYQGKYDEALPYAKATVDMDPNFFLGRNTLGLIYEMKGSYAEALIEAKRVLELNDDPNYLANLAHLYAVSGKRNEALKTLEQMKQIASGGDTFRDIVLRWSISGSAIKTRRSSSLSGASNIAPPISCTLRLTLISKICIPIRASSI